MSTILLDILPTNLTSESAGVENGRNGAWAYDAPLAETYPHLANDWWIDPDRRLGVIIWGDYQALGSH